MIALAGDFRRPILEPPEKNPLPFAPRPEPGGALGKRLLSGRSSRWDAVPRNGLNYSVTSARRRDRVN